MFSVRPVSTPTTPTTSTTTTTSSSMDKTQRQAAARRAAAKSKNKLWGPSHSYDSDETRSTLGAAKLQPPGNSPYDYYPAFVSEQVGRVLRMHCHTGDTTTTNTTNTHTNTNNSSHHQNKPSVSWWDQVVTKAWTDTSHVWSGTWNNNNKSPTANTNTNNSTRMTPVKEEEDHSTEPSTQEEEEEPNEQTTHNYSVSRSAPQQSATTRNKQAQRRPPSTPSHNLMDDDDDDDHVSFDRLKPPKQPLPSRVDEWADMFHNACSPCSAQDLEDLFALNSGTKRRTNKHQRDDASNLGIAPLELELDQGDTLDVSASRSGGTGHPNTSMTHSRTTNSHSRTTATTNHPLTNTTSGPALDTTANSSRSSHETPAERRRQRAAQRRQRHEDAASVSSAPFDEVEVTSQQDVLIHQNHNGAVVQKEHLDIPPPSTTSTTTSVLPMTTLLVKTEEAQALERSISELTMRSSYHEARHLANNEHRRMAYYAVGKHHRNNSGKGGNRRCYFTGKLILGGNPFYAGSVQQGLRTLVVFCVPSALGMPHDTTQAPKRTAWYNNPHSVVTPSVVTSSGLLRRRTNHPGGSIVSRSPSSKVSCHNDDLSWSVAGDLDPNWNIDKDWLLQHLPHPSPALLGAMASRYPEQFETLPVQVRHAACWRLYVKFCFFSGLPIAEGELHYKVRDELAYEYGEEVVLSHDVMEAVNGASSADILRLPNVKTFQYLKQHYQQQSAKLPEVVFSRTSWEQVKAEV